eukprot:6483697-Amphidinium_carterae.3
MKKKTGKPSSPLLQHMTTGSQIAKHTHAHLFTTFVPPLPVTVRRAPNLCPLHEQRCVRATLRHVFTFYHLPVSKYE